MRIVSLFILLYSVVSAQDPPSVRLAGDSVFIFENLPSYLKNQRDWRQLITIKIDDPDPTLPDLLGNFLYNDERLEFRPRFPLVSRQSYRVLSPGLKIDTLLTISELKAKSTCITAIYPSSNEWPENLLRFYIEFSQPMSLANPYRYIRLIDKNGFEVNEPFVEIPQGLWNENRTRLTVFFHPGRLKRNVGPNLTMGPPLQAGRQYQIAILDGWRDHLGNPVPAGVIKTFETGEADRTAISIEKWSILLPRVGSTEPLTLDLLESLDVALLQRCITILNPDHTLLHGKVAVVKQESQWQFNPELPWKGGQYSIIVDPILEDPAGNSVTKEFDRDIKSSATGTHKTVTRTFTIQ